MRGLKAILTAAGEAKKSLDYDEDILVLISLLDVNIPKFTRFNKIDKIELRDRLKNETEQASINKQQLHQSFYFSNNKI